jgi:hypothetical protein
MQGLFKFTFSWTDLSVLLLLEKSKRSPLSKENLRNAILRAISIAVDPLSE